MSKVSVIIPVYNVEKYLRECLESVINQTLKDIEIICVNDGSTDNSLEILKEYAQKDERIVVISQENSGVSIARNVALDCAKGEYVCFMDPDDLYPDNDVLEVLYNKAKENNVKICGGEFSEFKENVIDLNQNFDGVLSGYLFKKNEIIEFDDYQFDYGFTRFLYETKFLTDNNIRFPNYKRYEDPVFFVNAMVLAKHFYAVHKNVYAYRIGYKPLNWSYETVKDFFTAVLDVLNIAQEHSLNRLIDKIFICFVSVYYKQIRHYIKPYNKNLFNKFMNIFPDSRKKIMLLEFKLLLRKILSIKNFYDNNTKYKIITFMGLSLKIRYKNKYLR